MCEVVEHTCFRGLRRTGLDSAVCILPLRIQALQLFNGAIIGVRPQLRGPKCHTGPQSIHSSFAAAIHFIVLQLQHSTTPLLCLDCHRFWWLPKVQSCTCSVAAVTRAVAASVAVAVALVDVAAEAPAVAGRGTLAAEDAGRLAVAGADRVVRAVALASTVAQSLWWEGISHTHRSELGVALGGEVALGIGRLGSGGALEGTVVALHVASGSSRGHGDEGEGGEDSEELMLAAQ